VLSAWDAGDRNKVKSFIDSGGDINARDRDQWTCLHRAAFLDRVDAVRNLIESGADPDLPVLPGGSKRTVDIVRNNNKSNAGQIASLLTSGGRL
jgi:ankyrin repeat protein